MKNLYFIFFFLYCILNGYCDAELDQLYASISDINHPTLEDYQRMEDHLQHGKRAYLDPLRNSLSSMREQQSYFLFRFNLIQNIKLLGPHNELPIFERYYYNADHSISKRCIVIFASYNRMYPEKARRLLSDLLKSGYKGDIILRIGGFPNVSHGGLKICHVPYAFKVAFLYEAKLLGYKQILWLDTALHPMTNLEKTFAEIEKKGYFFLSVGTLSENDRAHLPAAALSLNITPNDYRIIPHISSGIMGLNMGSKKAVRFLENWYKETERISPNLTWFPEELSMSVVAWREKCQPTCWFGKIVCNEKEVSQLQNRPTVQFFIDGLR